MSVALVVAVAAGCGSSSGDVDGVANSSAPPPNDLDFVFADGGGGRRCASLTRGQAVVEMGCFSDGPDGMTDFPTISAMDGAYVVTMFAPADIRLIAMRLGDLESEAVANGVDADTTAIAGLFVGDISTERFTKDTLELVVERNGVTYVCVKEFDGFLKCGPR